MIETRESPISTTPCWRRDIPRFIFALVTNMCTTTIEQILIITTTTALYHLLIKRIRRIDMFTTLGIFTQTYSNSLYTIDQTYICVCHTHSSLPSLKYLKYRKAIIVMSHPSFMYYKKMHAHSRWDGKCRHFFPGSVDNGLNWVIHKCPQWAVITQTTSRTPPLWTQMAFDDCARYAQVRCD